MSWMTWTIRSKNKAISSKRSAFKASQRNKKRFSKSMIRRKITPKRRRMRCTISSRTSTMTLTLIRGTYKKSRRRTNRRRIRRKLINLMMTFKTSMTLALNFPTPIKISKKRRKFLCRTKRPIRMTGSSWMRTLAMTLKRMTITRTTSTSHPQITTSSRIPRSERLSNNNKKCKNKLEWTRRKKMKKTNNKKWTMSTK